MVNSEIEDATYSLLFTIHPLPFAIYQLSHVSQVKCHFLYYPLSGDRHRARTLAVGSAGYAGTERLG